MPTGVYERVVVKELHRGQRLGRLIVISDLIKNHHDKRSYLCLCDCGEKRIVPIYDLLDGTTKSCGCLSKEISTTHGMCKTSTYKSWVSMKERCLNPNTKGYYNYGGRGIRVCNRWQESFENFYKDMGDRPNKTTLDRIDVNGNYNLKNCQWATQKTQLRNMRKTVRFSFKGHSLTIREWSERFGWPYNCLKTRFRRKWSVERALTIIPMK